MRCSAGVLDWCYDLTKISRDFKVKQKDFLNNVLMSHSARHDVYNHSRFAKAVLYMRPSEKFNVPWLEIIDCLYLSLFNLKSCVIFMDH